MNERVNEVDVDRDDMVDDLLEGPELEPVEIEVLEPVRHPSPSQPGPSTLIAHVDTNKVTREELALLPMPEGTETFKPVHHMELVNSIEAVLMARRISIVNESFAVRADGSRLFGTFDLSLEGVGESCGALGFRTGNDRTMKLQMIAGLRVFVCDNMSFAGDSIILNRKHSKGLDLLPELMGAVGKYTVRYEAMRAVIVELTQTTITDTEAKATIFDAFNSHLMPGKYMEGVAKAYFEPLHEEFEPRTAWSLHNAFTEVAKDMALNRRMEAMQGISKLFGL